MSPPARYEFSADDVTDLLGALDERLVRRGVSAAVFVVGGAAVAALHLRGGRLTADVDALSDDPVVIEEAAALAAERGIPGNWLNSSARAWMPPFPDGVLEHQESPGLRVTYADESFLFATKLVAQRRKDADDLVALARRLGMQSAGAEELAAHIRRYYIEPDVLRFIVGSDDVDTEVHHLAQDAARLLAKSGQG